MLQLLRALPSTLPSGSIVLFILVDCYLLNSCNFLYTVSQKHPCTLLSSSLANADFYRASAVAASPVLATIGMSVRLSVRPSVTRWHCVKTTQASITKSSPTNSRTLVFGIKNSSRNWKGFTPSEGVKWEGVGKIRNFQPISRRISETVQDRTKVTIND